MNRELYLQRI